MLRSPFTSRSPDLLTVPLSLTASVNDYGTGIATLQDYTSEVVVILSSTASPWTVTGLSLGQSPTRSRRATFLNLTGSVAFAIESGLSLAANRIAANTGMGTTATLTLGSITMVYDCAALRWRIVGGTAGASVIYV